MSFKILVSNCCGAGNDRFRRAVFDLIKDHHPSMVVLLEPRVSGHRAEEVCRQIGFQSCFRVDAHGFSGGIWVLWNPSDLSVTIETHSSQFVNLSIQGLSFQPWNFAAIYASPRASEREELWSDLYYLSRQGTNNWLLAGDFNSIRSADEKKASCAWSNLSIDP